MARLNEAPAQTTESVEALKRRFVRQNRDLARINTSQSLRIRSLELEQSHLQTENLCLREENLRLRQRLSESIEQPQVVQINRIKTELERLVSELGQVQKPEQEEGQKRMPDPSGWRPPVPNLRLAGQELRMPPIDEDKMYPRRTLGADEIRAIRLSDHSTDSPDLGPPPMAHFECSDPIKFDRTKLEQAQSDLLEDEEPREIPIELAQNLETRRKRRETTPRQAENVEGNGSEPLTSVSTSQANDSSRGSVKRKLSVREEDDATSTPTVESFSFTRKSSILGTTSDGPHEDTATPASASDGNTQTTTTHSVQERKVLGDKSTNTSPRKVVVGKKPAKSLSKTVPNVVEGTDAVKIRARRPKMVSIPPPRMEEAQDNIQDTQPEQEAVIPTTPSAPDLFSPTASEPSSLRNEQTHDAVTTANLEGMRRPSRRARAVASYAEPSLNTKMRRPSQAFVDAVYANHGKPTGTERTSVGGSTIKRESSEDEEESWKSLLAAAMEPTSPLSSKANVSALRASSPSASRSSGGTKDSIINELSEELRVLAVKDKPRRRASSAGTRRHSSVALETLSSSPASAKREDSPPIAVDPVAKSGIKVDRGSGRRRSMLV